MKNFFISTNQYYLKNFGKYQIKSNKRNKAVTYEYNIHAYIFQATCMYARNKGSVDVTSWLLGRLLACLLVNTSGLAVAVIQSASVYKDATCARWLLAATQQQRFPIITINAIAKGSVAIVVVIVVIERGATNASGKPDLFGRVSCLSGCCTGCMLLFSFNMLHIHMYRGVYMYVCPFFFFFLPDIQNESSAT